MKVKNFAEVKNGFAFKSEKYVDSGIRVIRINNVQKGYIIDEMPAFYPMSERDSLLNYMLEKDDILLSLTGNVGRVALLEKKYLPAALNQRVACIRVDKNYALKKYIYYAFLSKKFENDCIMSSQGIAQKNMSTEWLKEYDINIAKLDNQYKIVEIFDKLISCINLYETQLKSLDLLVKSRFVEMFGNPETNPKKWTEAKMGDYMTLLTDFSSNGSYKTLDSNVQMKDEEDYAWMVRTTDLENNEFKNVKYIDEKTYNFLEKSKIYGDEIIMCKIGSAGKVYLMPKINKPASLGRNAFMFRYNDEINRVYLYYLLNTDYGQKEIMSKVRGAVTKTITKDDARAVKILVPPKKLQDEFEELIAQVDKSKFAVQKALEKAKMLMDSLMQEYFG